MPDTIRIGTWNVNAFNPKRSEDKVRLLELYEWDLMILQEVGPKMWAALTSAGWDGAYSLNHINDLPRRPHGVAVVTKNDLHLSNSRLISAEIPPGFEARGDFPARLMSVSVETPFGALFEAVAFHSYHAAGSDLNRGAKMGLYAAAHGHLRTIDCGVIGFDGNCWSDQLLSDEVDPGDPFFQELCFHHHDADHGFHDAWHQVLRFQSDQLARLRHLGREGKDGCLAVTYQRSRNGHVRTNRMDRIYITSQFLAQQVEHHYAEALAMGSDHALVIATLEHTLRADTRGQAGTGRP